MSDDRQSLGNIPVIYTNNIRLALSFADCRLFVGEVLPAEIGQRIPGEPFKLSSGAKTETIDRLCLVISPDILPQLVAGLQEAIKSYEATFGTLRKIEQVIQRPPATGPSK